MTILILILLGLIQSYFFFGIVVKYTKCKKELIELEREFIKLKVLNILKNGG